MMLQSRRGEHYIGHHCSGSCQSLICVDVGVGGVDGVNCCRCGLLSGGKDGPARSNLVQQLRKLESPLDRLGQLLLPG